MLCAAHSALYLELLLLSLLSSSLDLSYVPAVHKNPHTLKIKNSLWLVITGVFLFL